MSSSTYPPLPSSPHIAGLVLARGGSKGITLKNLAPLGSKPLISWCLQSMLEFGKFDSVWVSTDHEGIGECATACGAKVHLFYQLLMNYCPFVSLSVNYQNLRKADFSKIRSMTSVSCQLTIMSPFMTILLVDLS